jgi:predicted phosphodiesterase
LRILLLSDIHSNLEAFKSCLDAAPEHDMVVNLGDIVGYGASPNEVTDCARSLAGTLVRGNHDKVVTGLDRVETFNPIAGVAALWNREQLSPERLAWLRNLPKGPVAMDGVPDVQFVHGAPDDEDHYLLTIDEAAQQLLQTTAAVIFFGHTHVQGGFLLRSGIPDTVQPQYNTVGKKEKWEFHLETGEKYLINPGSVGQPRDGDWRAAFAMFDTESRIVQFFRTPYELRSAQEKIFAANLPARLATRLAAGR